MYLLKSRVSVMIFEETFKLMVQDLFYSHPINI